MATMEESYNQRKSQVKRLTHRTRCHFFTHSGQRLPLILNRVQMVFIQSLILEERQHSLGETTSCASKFGLIISLRQLKISGSMLWCLGDNSNHSER